MLRGNAATAILADLQQRNPKAFAAAGKHLRDRGMIPTDTVIVARTSGAPTTPDGVSSQDVTITTDSGQAVFWSWTDHDESTWEGVLYGENWDTGSSASIDGQVDTSTDAVIWEETTYWDHRGPHDKDPLSLAEIGGNALAPEKKKFIKDLVGCFVGCSVGCRMPHDGAGVS